ncbi:hypothetical protein C5167_046548 [Papaver somniferum]|uniref:S1 motif domain-containing protein n=1 Tax=Papaver somniferum TaxID=3469 RepID=A0A4Y7LGT1_PAPSO|nr:putative exosome complex component rrp40 isoform X2 [Papaver somniferum]RZC83758.1 hypothetical protein C5167_046548 [Papaver somniferum]
MVEEKKHSDSQSTMVKKIVVPGDVVLDLLKLSNQTIKLGDGLRQYVPCVENTVLGIVLDSKADNFLVDIKGPAVAFLPVLAFEGGTRRNIPKFEPASLIYVRVVKANMGMNPELSCTDVNGKAAEVGALKAGYMFETSTGLSRISRVSWEEVVL